MKFNKKDLKNKDILKTKPNLKICPNHLNIKSTHGRVWHSLHGQGIAYADGHGWYCKQLKTYKERLET